MAHHLLFAKQSPKSSQQIVELENARSSFLSSIQEGVGFLREYGLVESARHASDIIMGRCELLTSDTACCLRYNCLNCITCIAAKVAFGNCRKSDKLPQLLEGEKEVLAQKIGDAWNAVASMPPGVLC